MSAEPIMIEVGAGELIDKITILTIKSERMSDAAKLKNVRYELEVLSAARDANLQDTSELQKLTQALKEVNEALWDIEDDIRACEREKDFSDKFVQLARAVYITNDKRAALKKDINLATGAQIIEEKSYTEFE
ncbi:MAG: hypothetical protein JJ939_08320 [Alphaproteobacteria bacterium]|nr:hypothetical protein [Alphaproteobacteria bacterium]MBO6628411.1 hypothetical protein [Alphaproteobacteria bacterium]MDF1626074.1 DUF6165 family protein [Parvibaculaceae bacterium]|tara:strand:- start:195 stop:593 length:399 start_codon:yes stop_codon:yes gene_type:complete